MPQHELTLPDLGIDDQPITVSSWLVKRGTPVTEEDPVVEVLCGGVTVDLPAAGRWNHCWKNWLPTMRFSESVKDWR